MHFTESSLATSFYRSRWAVNFDLSEQGNMWFSTVKYTDYGGKMMTTLHFVWELDEEFEGIRDFKLLATSWLRKGNCLDGEVYLVLCKRMQEGTSCNWYQWITLSPSGREGHGMSIRIFHQKCWICVLAYCNAHLITSSNWSHFYHELHHKKFETIMTRFRHRYRTRIDQNQQDEDHIIFTKAIPNWNLKLCAET